MPELSIHLVPTPGAKPEFLATVETPENTSSLPSKIVLEGYTRDAWSWKPHPAWTTVEVTPTTQKYKEKLGGFLKYLKERQKCAYGRFSPTSVLVVSYIQSANKTTFRFTMDAIQVPNCNIITKKPQNKTSTVAPQSNIANKPPIQPSSRKKTGMLGNLLGAQQRVDHHLDATHIKKPKSTATDDTCLNAKTAQQVLQKFRETMQQKMFDFDIEDDNNVLQVKISLADVSKDLQGEEKTKVTMDVLKYIVYEQAEEVNEEWVGLKEPSEFMDEVIISVYKEAPPEVLEEVNKAELPDEIRGQQRAIEEARRKEIAKKEALQEKHLMALATAQDEDLATLNINKRDRRTIEEIQREMNNPKRARTQES